MTEKQLMDRNSRQPSLQAVANDFFHRNKTLEETLAEMTTDGTSLILNWGEDNNLWECSWIVNDKRYTAHSKDVRNVVLSVLNQLFTDLMAVLVAANPHMVGQ